MRIGTPRAAPGRPPHRRRPPRCDAAALVAAAGAAVAEAAAGLGDEAPAVAVAVQREREDSERRAVATLAVGARDQRGVVAAAAGPDDELADPAARVGAGGRGLGGEALVVVVVAVEHDV